MRKFSLAHGMCMAYGSGVYKFQRRVGSKIQFESITDGQIISFEEKKLLVDYTSGKIAVLPEGTQIEERKASHNLGEDFSLLPKAHQAEVVRRKAYIDACLDSKIGKGQAALMAGIIKEVAARIEDPRPPSLKSVRIWWQRYEVHEHDPASLAPRFSIRGLGGRFCDRVWELVDIAIKAKYLVREKGSVMDVFEEALRLISIENEKDPALQYECPSRRTIARRIRGMNQFDVSVERDGYHAARNKFRTVLHANTSSRPGERTEFDNGLMDAFVIDDVHLLPLGRPMITPGADHYSSMPVGFWMSFHAPSAEVVLNAIRSSILPKTDIRGRFPNIKNDWPAYGVSETYVFDNGMDFHSKDVSRVLFELNSSLQFCKIRQPWLKGGIERFIGECNSGLFQKLPGTTFRNILERDDYNSAEKATITFSEMTEIAFTWLIDYYAMKPNERKLGARPIDLWNEGITGRPPVLPASVDDLNVMIGLSVQRRLRHEGILQKGLIYNSEELQDLRRQHGAELDIDVKLISTIDTVYVRIPHTRKYLAVPCINTPQDYQVGLTWYQHRLIRQFCRQENAKRVDIPGLIKARQRLRDIFGERLDKRGMAGRKDAARAANIDSNAVLNGVKATTRQLFGNASSGRSNPPKFLEADDIPTFTAKLKGRQP